ncbi:hypothetical protein BU24DRAFT_462411 [Aaosphaeria arxii CBS 175.79]|uniref:Uncharacterized protein n=1 Tax=Aaosphaeria arxii CBS 175.79 TaxID=1450172 RepID=A0A6A5XUA6_9PLEO|nr:uncharacterized protein BU24DRAFT_462411 [Aaosphaeria arxii CBS 175.79]KAF2016230.1 hypothetical protein BU24DRAFT_462411 [Aaosphaeria arxii CBS 175.79]
MPCGTPHPEVRSSIISDNPEYNTTVGLSFRRTEDGRRLSPRSQLNTLAGRLLDPSHDYQIPGEAPHQTALNIHRKPSPYPRMGEQCQEPTRARPDRDAIPKIALRHEKRSVAQSTVDENTSKAHGTDRDQSGPIINDDGKQSLRPPRTELSQLLSMTRGSSINGTSHIRAKAQGPLSADTACNTCKVSGSYNPRSPCSGPSHFCNRCHRFVGSAIMTVSSKPSQKQHPVLHQREPPPTLSKCPTIHRCKTCQTIPPDIYDEYQRFFPLCIVCKQMTDITRNDIVDHGGEVPPLVDGQGKQILGASKELHNWCSRVFQAAHDLNRVDSKISQVHRLPLARETAINKSNSGVKRDLPPQSGSKPSSNIITKDASPSPNQFVPHPAPPPPPPPPPRPRSQSLSQTSSTFPHGDSPSESSQPPTSSQTSLRSRASDDTLMQYPTPIMALLGVPAPNVRPQPLPIPYNARLAEVRVRQPKLVVGGRRT